MKKQLTLIISLFALAWSSSCYAYDFYAVNRQGDTIYYNFGQNNTVEVTYCNTYFEDIDTGIYYHGEIVIPDTVEYQGKKYAVELGKSAFCYCKRLTKVVLPAHVTIIPQYCFGGCENLTEVSGFQQLVRIEDGGFNNCKKLAVDSLPGKLQRVGNGAFWGCSSLHIDHFPKSLSLIGGSAFANIDSLADVLVIPTSIKTFATQAFKNTRINTLVLPYLAKWLQGGMGYATPLQEGIYHKVILPDTLQFLPNQYFLGCTIDSVVMPSRLKRIGSQVFKNSSIAYCPIPPSCDSLMGAFINCRNLREADLSQTAITTMGMTEFGDPRYAAMKGTPLLKIKLPKGLKWLSSSYIADSAQILVFPPTVKKMRHIIYAYAKYGHVFLSATPPTVENFSTDPVQLGEDTLRAIYVPCASLESYRNTKPWSQSRNLHGVHFRNEEIVFDTVCVNHIWNRFGFKPKKAGFYTAFVPNDNDCDSMFMIEIRHLLNDSGGKITEGSVRADTTGGGKAIRWSWQGTADYYEVYRNGTRIATVTGTSYTDSDIAYNVEYCYEFVPAAGRCEGMKSAKQCITLYKTGVRETSKDYFSVQPNPASEKVHVTCNQTIRNLFLYDVTGRECLRMEVGTAQTDVNLSGLPRGLYLLKVQTDSGSTVKKVVVE